MDIKYLLARKRVQGAVLLLFGLAFPSLFARLGDAGTLELVGAVLDVAGVLWHLYGQYTKKMSLHLRPRAKK